MGADCQRLTQPDAAFVSLIRHFVAQPRHKRAGCGSMQAMLNRPLIRLTAAVLCLSAPAAWAQMFTDPALEALFKARQFAELDRAGQQRLAARADDRQAVLALAVAVQQAESTKARREAAIARAEVCVDKQPQAAECHFALGATLGVHAVNEGLMAMAGSAGRVQESLRRALELAPAWYAARSAMVTFYVVAPGLMGGSQDKALQTARAAAKPEQARALQAFIDLNAEKPEAALAVLQGIPAGGDSVLDDDVRDWGNGAAFALLNAGQPARARDWFERLLRERPADARAAYGLGRVHAESQAHAEALAWYDKSRRGEGAASLPIDYRAGLSHQALGQAAAARESLGRFVKAGKGPKKSLDDARKRLEQLGAS